MGNQITRRMSYNDDVDGERIEIGETAKQVLSMVTGFLILLATISLGVEIGLYVMTFNLCCQTYAPCGTIAFAAVTSSGIKKNKSGIIKSIFIYGIVITVYNCILFFCYLMTLILSHVLMETPGWFTEIKRNTPAVHHIVDPILGVGVVSSVAQICLGAILIVIGKKIRYRGQLIVTNNEPI
ncbi:uncharacterized protein LOC141909912 [Tubulanus polymorphus]|uniref:uncharacterized protein LOC141909912 n=1 Tax=Tubulanus polymorphus TaxID=672921 RepID=UPI003DA3A5DD